MIDLMKERPPWPRAAADKWWPFFGGYEEPEGVVRRDSLPPYDGIAIPPGIAIAPRWVAIAGLGSQFMKHNVEVTSDARLHRAAN